MQKFLIDSMCVKTGQGRKFVRVIKNSLIFRAFYFYLEELQKLFEANGFKTDKCEYLFKKTTNFEKNLSVDRVFVQGRFQKI